MFVREPEPILIAGATGYVGSKLVDELQARGHAVRTLSRRGTGGGDARTGDVLSGRGLPEALDGVKTAYYLVHSMGSGGDLAAKDRQAAINFAEAAAGVERVIYLGGLGAEDSEHLRSRHEVAQQLRARLGDRLVYVRAAMIIGGREHVPAELQLGGAEVLTYREMMRRAAPLMGRRPPLVIRVPVLTPRLSSYWVALVTPVSYGLIRPLVDGLGAEMVVTQAPPRGLNDEPLGFDAAVREALA
jgi:uncharacterized protein YbjT (DUF2867 family)